VLGRLRLTTGRAARVCGVTRRQLCYWTDQGMVKAVEPSAEALGDDADGAQRVYDCGALQKVLLLKQSLARGWGVRRAAKEADTHLEESRRREETLRASSPEERQPLLAEQAQRLEEAAERLRDLVATAGRDRLLAVAAQAEALGQVCGRILGNGAAMHEDVDGCLEVETGLERLEAGLEPSEDASL